MWCDSGTHAFKHCRISHSQVEHSHSKGEDVADLHFWVFGFWDICTHTHQLCAVKSLQLILHTMFSAPVLTGFDCFDFKSGMEFSTRSVLMVLKMF